MRLFIDDIRSAPDDTWIVARTCSAAIGAIARFKDDITEISLDHDISHQVAVGETSRPYPCEETFQAVAYYIASIYTGSDSPPRIVLHTANPVGAREMFAILADAGIEAIILAKEAANRLELEI